MPRPLAPDTVGPYRLLRRIGAGGTAIVYEGTRDGQDRWAIKILRPDLCRQPEVQRRFEREARLLREIDHPSIVPVVANGVEGDYRFLVMPLMDSPTLRSLMERLGPIEVPGPIQVQIRALVPVLVALQAIHQRGVVHRDITPSNIFVPEDGVGLIADFGLVKILGSETVLTQTGALIGTVPYMAPEQLSARPVSPASDLYQVGLVVYEMVAGRLPFERTLSDVVRAKCLEPTLPDPRDLGAKIPEALATVILDAVRQDPAERPRSAIEMSLSLHRCLVH